MLWIFLLTLVVLSVILVARVRRTLRGVALLHSLYTVRVREERAQEARGVWFARFPMLWARLDVHDLYAVRNELMYYGSEAAAEGDEEAVEEFKGELAYVDRLIAEK